MREPTAATAADSARASAVTRRDAVFVAACVLVALALRMPLLTRSVWFDEACMSSQRIGTWEQLLATLYVDIHPPLFVTGMHFWGRCFGDREVALRLPAVLTGLAAAPLLFWTGYRLVGPTAARWAVVLLVLSPAHIWYSAEARLYAPMVAFTLLLFATFDRALDPATHRRRRWFGVHLAVLAVVLTLHYYLAVYVLVLAGLAAGALRRVGRPARSLLVAYTVGLVLLAGFVLAKHSLGEFDTGQDYLTTLNGERLLAFVFDWCWTGHTLLPAETLLTTALAWTWLLLGAGLLVLGVQRLMATARRQPRSLLVLVGFLTLPLFLLACNVCGYDRTYLARSVIPALPFVLLLGGNGLATFRGVAARIAGGATVALAVAAVIGLYVLGDSHWTVYKPSSDWRSATAWLGSEIDADGAGRAVFTSTPNPRPLSYYDPRIQDVKNLAMPILPEQLGARVRRHFGGWLGTWAECTFRTFAARNATLLATAKLRVYRSTSDPADLDMPHRSKDDICYLLQDLWHPHRSVDSSVWDLREHPRVRVLGTFLFQGIAVHKVSILP
jgi:hypothetical protein